MVLHWTAKNKHASTNQQTVFPCCCCYVVQVQLAWAVLNAIVCSWLARREASTLLPRSLHLRNRRAWRLSNSVAWHQPVLRTPLPHVLATSTPLSAIWAACTEPTWNHLYQCLADMQKLSTLNPSSQRTGIIQTGSPAIAARSEP